MGSCCSSFNNKADFEIETHMLQHKQIDSSVKKLLLLGSGSSGKSTLFKQLKCIFNPWGLDTEEFVETTHSIRENVVSGMLKLLHKSQELYDLNQTKYEKCLIPLHKHENIMQCIAIVLEFRHETFEHLEYANWQKIQKLGDSIYYLWKEVDALRATFNERGTKFSFADNMEYFFDKSKIIFAEDFYPSHEDVLKCRIRTTGMVEITYEIKDLFFNIYDVGGQRNERKKWIHSFEGVTAVIYVAALSHFDAVCFEDERQNAMQESISLFKEICNSKWFKRTAMILFLNKSDLFQEKLMDFLNIGYCFSKENGWNGEAYDGPLYECDGNDEWFEDCCRAQTDFIANAYYQQRQNENKKIFTHITNATDRNNVEKVFWDCQNIIIRKNLSIGGFS